MKNTLLNQITGGATVRNLPQRTRRDAQAAARLADLCGGTPDAKHAIKALELKAAEFIAAYARVTALLDTQVRAAARAELHQDEPDRRSPEQQRADERRARRGGVATRRHDGVREADEVI